MSFRCIKLSIFSQAIWYKTFFTGACLKERSGVGFCFFFLNLNLNPAFSIVSSHYDLSCVCSLYIGYLQAYLTLKSLFPA